MRRGLALAILLGLQSLTPADAPGCGPMFLDAEFVPAHHPGVAMKDFNAGKLGVISGELWLEHLIPAWRHLQGKPPARAAIQQPSVNEAHTESNDRVWLRAREAFMKSPGPEHVEPYRKTPGDQYDVYLNCNGAAFATAAETLRQRSAKLDTKLVAAWIKAQDIVFANCSEGTGVPADVEPGAPALAKADRLYQIASAHFYAGRFDDARSEFLRIAKDSSSPWQRWSPYLAARCLIRKATLYPAASQGDLPKAGEEMRAISRTSTDAQVKEAARQMSDLIESRLNPDDALARIANKLSDPARDADFHGNLREFDLLWMRRGAPEAARVRSDLYEWLLAMRGRRPVDLARATKDEAFLIAALVHTENGSRDASGLLDIARSIKPGSPAYATVAYHVYRLREKSLSAHERRQYLDAALANLKVSLPRSAWSPFLEKRLPLSANFTEFLQTAPRAPAGASWDDGTGPSDWAGTFPELLLDADSATVFNKALPLSRWKEAAEGPHLTSHLRARVRKAAWARAVVLGDSATATALVPGVLADYPELKPFGNMTDAFAPVFLLLHASDVSPYLVPRLGRWDGEQPMRVTDLSEFRKNWWCASGPPVYGEPPEEKPLPFSAAFLSDAERAQGAKEYEGVKEAGAGPTFLARKTVEWVDGHRADPRAAEALHLVVAKVGRLSCSDSQTGAHTKRAFQLLHRLYPRSEWAKKTPYWYQ